MKSFILAFALLSSSVFAAEVHITDIGRYERLGSGSTYQFQRESGRAWVELQIDNGMPDSEYDYRRYRVEGMELVGNDVVLNGVVCGTIKRTGIFKYENVKATKACKFVTRTDKVTVDDGFEVKTVKINRVFLETAE